MPMFKPTGGELFSVDVYQRTLLRDVPGAHVRRTNLSIAGQRSISFKHKYVYIYPNKSNTANKCGGGSDEKGREAV